MPGINKIFIVVFLFAILFTSIINGQSDHQKFKHITAKQGLPSNTVYSSIRDSRGFMWFATGIGLYRYDGYEFMEYRNNPSDTVSLSGNLITSQLFIDNAGKLWVGTRNNGLNCFDTETEMSTRYMHDPDDKSSISSNNIHRLYQDEKGELWVATLGGGLNKLDKNNHEFMSFLPVPGDPSADENFIQSVIEYDETHLLTGTRKGLFILDLSEEIFIPFTVFSKTEFDFQQDVFVDIVDDNDSYWFATENGLLKFDKITGSTFRYQSDESDNLSLSSNIIRQIIEDPDKRFLWISTVWGLNKFNKENNINRRFLYDSDDPNSLGYNMLWGIFIDNSNLLWIGTDNAGVNLLNLSENQIKHHKIEVPSLNNEQYIATVFCDGSIEDLWVGTFEGGLWRFDSEMQVLDHYSYSSGKSNSLNSNSIFSLYLDSRDDLIVGTSNGGLDKLSNNIVSLDIPHSTAKISSSVIELMEDRDGVLWIGTLTGLYFYDEVSGNGIENILFDPLEHSLIRAICEDQDGNIWIGTHSDGLFKLMYDEKEKPRFINYSSQPDSPGSLSSNTVMSVYEDISANIWIATNQGLNRYVSDSDNFEFFGQKQGLESSFLYHIQGENNGVLWLTSSAGLVRFDPKSRQKTKLFEFRSDDSSEEIYPYSFYIKKDGELCIGGKYGNENGFFTFHPDSLKDNINIPELAITKFRVRNELHQTDTTIIAKKEISLKYDQNFFSFEFAALDFIDPGKNQYAFKLEGMDDEWIYPGSRRFANYTGVPPGEYIFRVKGSNNDGYWNEKGTSVKIIITPPPWLSWWAYMLYVILFSGILFSMFYYYNRRQRLLYKLNIEKIEVHKFKELDGLKSKFFANISHEFRTPLTLILGPLQKLLSSTSDKQARKDLDIIQRNAQGLQNLINQLLNISRVESGKMELQIRRLNLTKLLMSHAQSFESLSTQKDINYSVDTGLEDVFAFVDQDKIGKVLNNLLSNAFKFTPKRGSIEVSLGNTTPGIGNRQLTAGHIFIRVSDDGPGILDKDIEHVFDRFYLVDNTNIRTQIGSGIGLALVKELVELHQGNIRLESIPGKKTSFTVFLKQGKEHFSEDEIITEEDSDIEFITHHEVTGFRDEVQESDRKTNDERNNFSGKDESTPLLLIVEDNEDLRTYIRSFLEEDYRIFEAGDGEMGLQTAIENIPDLVLTDVMMPKMDGIELCEKLKTDERTSHIPVVLLTARASSRDRIEGLETGADDFITKPFDPVELTVRVKNLIIQRRKLKQIYINEITLEGIKEHINIDTGDQMISIEQKFLANAKEIVEHHLSDEEFDVAAFSKEMNLSRTQLHRKLRALLNLSSSEFIRSIRLNRAMIMLRKNTGNISEIALDVGFSNPSYFTECFKKQFGINPSEITRK